MDRDEIIRELTNARQALAEENVSLKFALDEARSAAAAERERCLAWIKIVDVGCGCCALDGDHMQEAVDGIKSGAKEIE